MSQTVQALSNQILANLPQDEWDQIRPHLIDMPIALRQSLYEPTHPITDLYFVEDGVVSLIVNIQNHEEIAAEVGIVGSEGVIGVTALLFANPVLSYQALVQIKGNVLRFNAATARSLLDVCPLFRNHCYRYLDILVKQTAQIAGCNLRHTVVERLARWLLMTHDRIQGDELPITQEFLATMLGVRRPGVSLSAANLQSAGLITQSRGRITIVDRQGLEGAACPCYHAIRNLYENSEGPYWLVRPFEVEPVAAPDSTTTTPP